MSAEDINICPQEATCAVSLSRQYLSISKLLQITIFKHANPTMVYYLPATIWQCRFKQSGSGPIRKQNDLPVTRKRVFVRSMGELSLYHRTRGEGSPCVRHSNSTLSFFLATITEKTLRNRGKPGGAAESSKYHIDIKEILNWKFDEENYTIMIRFVKTTATGLNILTNLISFPDPFM